MSVREDYKELSQTLSQMDEMVQVLEDMTFSTIESDYHFPRSIKEPFGKITMDELKEKTDEQLDLFMEKVVGYNTYHEFLENLSENENKRDVILEIKKSIDSLNESIADRDAMKKQADEALEDYIKYVNSPEYKKKKMEHLQKMKEEAEKEPNDYKRKEMLKKIEAIESSQSLSFLFSRFKELGEKEVESIKNTFFDTRKSNYVLQKFENKLKSSGYKKNSYKYLFNIEEMFLPEEYHVYNNLYLFFIARFVAYANTSSDIDKMYIQSIFINTINLVYHNFQTAEDENRMIEIVKTVDDHFTQYEDYFRENNSTAPMHPKRIAMEKDYEEKKRAILMQKLTDENVQFDSSLKTAELEALYRKEVLEEIEKEPEEENKTPVLEELKVENLKENDMEEKSDVAENISVDDSDVYLVDYESGEELPLTSYDDDDITEESEEK